MTNFRADSITNSRPYKYHQVVLSKIKSSPLFLQQNMQWSRNMVYSHFTLCLRARDYLKRLSQHPWYILWMRVKGSHHYKVTALGSCVKWPLVNVKMDALNYHIMAWSLYIVFQLIPLQNQHKKPQLNFNQSINLVW